MRPSPWLLALSFLALSALAVQAQRRPSPWPQEPGPPVTAAVLDPDFAIEWASAILVQVRADSERLDALHLERLLCLAEEGRDVESFVLLRADLGRALAVQARWQGRWRAAAAGAPRRELFRESRRGITELCRELDRLSQAFAATCAAPWPTSGEPHQGLVAQTRQRADSLQAWARLLSLFDAEGPQRGRWPNLAFEEFVRDGNAIERAAGEALRMTGQEVQRLPAHERQGFKEFVQRLGTVRDCAQAWQRSLEANRQEGPLARAPQSDFSAVLDLAAALAEERAQVVRRGGFGPRTSSEVREVIALTWAAAIRLAWLDAESRARPVPIPRPVVRIDWQRLLLDARELCVRTEAMSAAMNEPNLARELSTRSSPFSSIFRGRRDWSPYAQRAAEVHQCAVRLAQFAEREASRPEQRGEEGRGRTEELLDILATLDGLFGSKTPGGLQAQTIAYLNSIRGEHRHARGVQRADVEVLPLLDRVDACLVALCASVRQSGLSWQPKAPR